MRQRGSHIQLRKVTVNGVHNITVPCHKEIAKGTLNDILTSVGLNNGISKDELLKKLWANFPFAPIFQSDLILLCL